MGSVIVCDHPLIQHKLTQIRDERTEPKAFRELLEDVAMLMAYDLTRALPLKEIVVKTPVDAARGRVLAGPAPVLVPVLRAGLGMVGGVLRLLPDAKVGHIGLYRDHESLKPVEYYLNLPPGIEGGDAIVIDPMLATGGSAAAALRALKARGAGSVRLMCLIAAPEGIAAVHAEHPDADIYAAAVDERLNEHGYIVPGLGDAGDRMFGTA